VPICLGENHPRGTEIALTISSIGESAYIPGHGGPAPAIPTAGPEATSAAPSNHALSGTARLLGLSADQLSTALKAGSTLAQLAAHTGVPAPAVLSSVEHDLRVDAPGDGAALSDLQLAQIAAGIQSPAPAMSPAPARFDAYA
jgi:hypothetical protein